MNQQKLEAMQVQVRTGGKGTMRRKRKNLHKSTTTDEKKLQSSLKKMGVNPIQGFDEANMFKDDGTVLHFSNPKVQASLAANTFSISGTAETKQLSEMLPTLLTQFSGADGRAFSALKDLNFTTSKMFAKKDAAGEETDDVPELVGDFEEATKGDTA